MTNYNKGKIYKITDNGQNKCYIGSTTQPYLSNRLAQHRKKYNNYLKGKGCCYSVFSIFDEFGVDNCKIYLIEEFSCNSKEELHRREGQLQKETECVNKMIAGRTKKEYCEDNKEILHEKYSKYCLEHPDKRRETALKHYYQNKEAINKKQRQNYDPEKKKIQSQDYYKRKGKEMLEKKKQYRIDNPEKMAEYYKRRYANDKEKKATPCNCVCGAVIRVSDKARHEKTKKHQQFINQNNPQE